MTDIQIIEFAKKCPEYYKQGHSTESALIEYKKALPIYNTKETQLLPSQIGCISLEWLEEQIVVCKGQNYTMLTIDVLSLIKSQLSPLVPLLEDAWKWGTECNADDEDLSNYLSQPIIIKP